MINKKQLEAPFIQQIKSTLDHNVNNISPEMLRKIADIRQVALQKQKRGFWSFIQSNSAPPYFKWQKSLGFVTISAVILVLFFVVSPLPDTFLQNADDDISQLALTTDEIELYENLEFYLWLQDIPENHELLS